MKRILPLLILVAVLASCARQDSENVSQDTIWMHLELYFNDNTDITKARATFRFNNGFGTKLQLSNGAEILFNGDPLDWQSGLAYYESDLAGFIDQGSFEYTDLDGNVFTNSAEIHTVQFPIDLDSIPRPGSFEMFWSGDPLGNHESITVWLNGDLEGDAQTFFENDLGAESVIMGQNQLLELPVGYADMVMDRSYSPPMQESNSVGGVVSGRYRAESIEIYMD
jgi:hypothetical protein